MKKINRLPLFLISASLLVACSSDPPIDYPIAEWPTEKDFPVKEAHVRDEVVLWTHESIGGAAERHEEWADYLYDDYHRGITVRTPSKENATLVAKDGNGADRKNLTEEKKDSALKAKDKSIYSKDRSIYSKDRSIYANKESKKVLPKKAKPKTKDVSKNTKPKEKVTTKKVVKSKKQNKKVTSPKFNTVRTNTVDGKKVANSIVELKDINQQKVTKDLK